jgi:ATP-dependent RNA helicase RhlE
MFKELGLSDEILLSIERSGFIVPTPIQCKTIPHIFEGKDLLIEAQTGSGKTACFAWPIIQQLSLKQTENKTIRALILTPTRELALQISGAIYRFGEFLTNKVTVLTIIGGESISQQTLTLSNGVDIVVATPGRLIDLIGQKVLNISDIQFLVLDEADKVLDLGFAEELDIGDC